MRTDELEAIEQLKSKIQAKLESDPEKQ